METIFLADSWN